MYKFEKMFRDNDVKENDPELPRAIAGKIEKFRGIQAEITAHPEDKEGNQKRKAHLDDLDEQIMKTLPDFFEIEDEAETIKQKQKMEKQQKLDERAKAVGLSAGSSEEDIVKAEKAKKEKDKKEKDERDALDKRAAKVNLPAGSSEADITAAEKKAKEAEDTQKSEKEKREALDKRAVAIGLAAGASEADIDAAEKAAQKKKDDDEKAPATTNEGALEKLHKKGKTTVTLAELKAAGFNTGFWGPIGANGWRAGKYRIFRDDPNDTQFILSKIG